MKQLLLLWCSLLPLCLSTNAWSWPGLEYHLDRSGFASECYVPTAADNDSGADKNEEKAGTNSEEEEPDCD
jgi:hypothetical protein